MSGITDLLLSQLGGGQMDALAQSIGAPRSTTERAMEAAIPALIGGLARNATASPSGAASLASALERDHDGSALDNVGSLLGGLAGSGALGGLLGGGKKSGGLGSLLGGSKKGGLGGLLGAAAGAALSSRTTNGAGILKHIFGGRLGKVEHMVSKASGLDAGQASKLLMMLAPIVMGALGRLKKERELDAGGLAGLLGGERETLANRQPELGGFMAMLDSDGDGDVKDDVAELGAGLLKNFMAGR
ncbi:MAG: DUF937 domain-containing protein [Rhodothermales bacterium]|nr:DUF937 domain-containing protein [Rhodothermales bacterium]MBO6779929.1 DUF937 domain-containing protein [Rhodothermales bacterium]